MDKTLEQLPLPNFQTRNNTEINSEVSSEDVSIRTDLKSFNVRSNTEIYTRTDSIPRGVESIGHIGQMADFIDVYKEPKSPIMFPQAEDAIKSLNFSSGSVDATVINSVTEYYQTVIRLMQRDITPDEYYAKMPSLIESIKDFTLNETDWETLRDSILRVQRYIIHYMWEDMQKISKAMDEGFRAYQEQLNDWIDEANRYYSSDEFIPGGSVMLDHFGRGQGVLDRDDYEIQQNIRYLMDGMCVQISDEKPEFNGGTDERDQYPSNKQMVWIEVVEEVV